MGPADPPLGPVDGLLKILRFNWPWYASALAFNIIASFLLPVLAAPVRAVGFSMLFFMDTWLASSLAVSHWVYDRSSLVAGGWLDRILGAPDRIIILHAGQDEASRSIHRRFPQAQVAAFDFFDPAVTPESSLARARAAHRDSSSAQPWDLQGGQPLPVPFDLACAIFSAHEVREYKVRAALFSAVAQALSPGGRVLVVEHLRDVWNFAAYGPGFLHFLSRRDWEVTIRSSGLRPVETWKITPFVSVFMLEAQ